MSEAASLAPVATPLEIMPEQQKEMLAVITTNSLAPETAKSLETSFAPLFQTARSVLEKSRGITVTDASQKLEIKLASECRKALKAVRVEGDKVRKALKEDSLRRGRAVDGFYAILLHLTDAEETRLEEQEKFVARQEEQQRAALKATREAELAPFKIDTAFYQLDVMPQEAFAQLLENTKAAHQAKIEAAARAEAEKIAAENARLKEAARIAEENAKLKREAEEREAAALIERQKAEAAAAQARAEREAAEAAAAKAKAEAEELLAKERAAAAEALRIAEENARRAREAAEKEAARIKAEADAKLAEERRQAEAAAAKLKAEADAKLAEERRLAQVEADRIRAEAAEQKRISDESVARVNALLAEEARATAAKAKEIESARLAAIEAERVAKEKAAAAPDRDRLLTFANAIRAIELPEFSTDTAKSLAKVVESQRGKFLAWIEEKSAGL